MPAFRVRFADGSSVVVDAGSAGHAKEECRTLPDDVPREYEDGEGRVRRNKPVGRPARLSKFVY